MNTKTVRDSWTFYFEPRASEGEKDFGRAVGNCPKNIGREFCDYPRKVMELKNRDGKIQSEWGKIISQAFCWHKRYVQQSHNDLKIYFKLSFNTKIYVVLEMDDSKHPKRVRYKMPYMYSWTAWSSAILPTPMYIFLLVSWTV